jgi:ADP-heptose:LPS heptosyltransferase
MDKILEYSVSNLLLSFKIKKTKRAILDHKFIGWIYQMDLQRLETKRINVKDNMIRLLSKKYNKRLFKNDILPYSFEFARSKNHDIVIVRFIPTSRFYYISGSESRHPVSFKDFKLNSNVV